MTKRLSSVALVLLIVVTATSAACWPWRREPTGELLYVGPIERSITAGESLPGTDVRYVGLRDEEAALLIGDQEALKKKGDSLDWDGHPLPGVTLSLRQRIIWFSEESLHAAGTARLAIDEPLPTAASFPEEPTAIYKLPVTYNVKDGDTIPGTTIRYAGSGDEGAEIQGAGDYPYRKIADSISWEGQLREGVFLECTLRVVFYDENQLQVAGLATIGLQF